MPQRAPDFDAFVEGIDARIGEDRGLEHYGHHHRVAYEVGCNWKVYIDNYLEGYHVPHVHPGLNKLLDYRSYVTQTARWYSFQWSPLESGDELYGNGDALYYWMWPNTMLNIVPGRLQTNRVVPLGIDRCRVEFDFYYAMDDIRRGPGATRRRPELQRRSAGRGPDDLRRRAARAVVGLLRGRPSQPVARERRAPLPRVAARDLPRRGLTRDGLTREGMRPAPLLAA